MENETFAFVVGGVSHEMTLRSYRFLVFTCDCVDVNGGITSRPVFFPGLDWPLVFSG